ncbi:efflux RND transporter permease subunit [Aestuariibacter sp. AA17]|uniref:Efflux RND transporter permease subunit n=1 Tax=Fluctibacter corallii TaxID=2984329 RepID=A0ABT3ACU7_9ALTE|nr:efflux RND transporter permease subunit [Aestuariibacter sp. AA17]MCV2886449.1 efflux RND transporter permease subunit [Aestuariibacter sp. AA17]
MSSEQKRLPWYSVFFRSGHLLALSIIVILVAGYSAVTNLPRLEDPRIDLRNVLVITPYPGANAERVEALVSDVIEDELRQLHEINEIRSTSRAGISVMTVELQPWVSNDTNEQIFSKIRDRLADAYQQFPQGAGEPILEDQRGATAFTLLVALSPSATLDGAPDNEQAMTIVSRMASELADTLRNVSGTELVRTYGHLDEEITVEVDPFELAYSGITFAQLSQKIAGADPKLPAGVLRDETQNKRLQIATALDSVQVVRQIPIADTGTGGFLKLGDIASVSRQWRNPPQDIAFVNGERVVFVAARMQTTVRVDVWTERAKAALATFNQRHNGTVEASIVFEQNVYTEARLTELTQNLLLGCLVVMAVIFLFMGWRSSWIVGLALPLCAAFAVFSLGFFDEQIHQMSIFGIIIAIGLLIDNAIVITDEIRQHLLDANCTRIDALVKSLKHLFSPLLASTLTTILGFMPIFLLSGNIGDFIGSIAISVVMALIGSLFISLTIIAALAARYLPRGQEAVSQEQQLTGHWWQEGIRFSPLTTWYKTRLTAAVEKPWLPVAAVVVFSLGGFVLAGQLGNVFFPSADRDQFEVYVWTPEGTSIHATRKEVEAVNQFVQSESGVEQVTWLVGGSTPSVYYNQVMTRDNTPHFAQAVISTESVARAKALIPALQHKLDDHFPQLKVVVRAFGQGPPISAPIGVKIFGPDIEVLNRLGEEVRRHMGAQPGVINTTATVSFGEPEIRLDVHRDVSALAGLSLADIAAQLQGALDGRVGGSILEGTEEIPVRIRVPEAQRSDMNSLSAMPLHAYANRPIPHSDAPALTVGALGDLYIEPSVSSITRLDGERVNIVEGFLMPGVTAVDVSNRLQTLLRSDAFALPDGYRLQMAGDADEQQEALGLLAAYAPVLLVLMVTTLIITFSSVRLALVIASVAILSVGMGMFSLWLSGLPIGFNPLLGSAGLIGVAINGSIVVIAAIKANPNARQGNADAIVSETMSCSRHILSTTFTTVGGFIPLLLFSEGTFWPPLAVVLAGGVGFSVLLSLVFTPLVVGHLARKGKLRGASASSESTTLGAVTATHLQ